MPYDYTNTKMEKVEATMCYEVYHDRRNGE